MTDKIDGDIFDAVPKPKFSPITPVGFDNINLEEAKKRGVMASNTPGVLSEAVAEHSIALMLAVGRRIAESDKFARAGSIKAGRLCFFWVADFSEKQSA